ncbi:hypothetical protein [Nannocystis punicea]|uniref:Uncharacterized protein n=1 Tax=Nannocystis punicea TaxID=2995304 RepID=A0ABY7HEB4_9BACT|nr:hypothetical protein [Nannocystis poenicansa]WAS97473.1 hypothetical protein O0S08_15105 [Nannocystis poenicansa]
MPTLVLVPALVLVVDVPGSPVLGPVVDVPVESLTPPLTVVPVVGTSVPVLSVPVGAPVGPVIVVPALSPVPVPPLSPPDSPQATITIATNNLAPRLAISPQRIDDAGHAPADLSSSQRTRIARACDTWSCECCNRRTHLQTRLPARNSRAARLTHRHHQANLSRGKHDLSLLSVQSADSEEDRARHELDSEAARASTAAPATWSGPPNVRRGISSIITSSYSSLSALRILIYDSHREMNATMTSRLVRGLRDLRAIHRP